MRTHRLVLWFQKCRKGRWERERKRDRYVIIMCQYSREMIPNRVSQLIWLVFPTLVDGSKVKCLAMCWNGDLAGEAAAGRFFLLKKLAVFFRLV